MAIEKQTEYQNELIRLTKHTELVDGDADAAAAAALDIVKSDFSELFFKLSELYNNFTEIAQEYITNLSTEQMVILFNLCGYSLLMMLFTSISSLLIGNLLINYFEFEIKLPKLAKYIKFKLKLRQFNLRIYIVYSFALLTLLIGVNIFMFTYNLYLP
jgi:hypothetical protein